jgi:response regulator RpfG family c-di-GMP phosphodiesterase
MTAKVLLVDDDDRILSGYSRHLCKSFEIWTASEAKKGLEILEKEEGFAVVVSDMRMPGMDGIEFLGAVTSGFPNTSRIMLTGNADQQTAIDAVNEGNIFRFYTKPCPPETLEKAIKAGLDHYNLIMAEKSLLEQTLAGSVKVLVDVLSVSAREAFCTTRLLRDWAREMARRLDMPNAWELDVAAMLSPIGQITVPAEVTAKAQAGKALTSVEWDMVNRVPEVGSKLIDNIPRLQAVSRIVYFQDKGFDGSGFPNDWVVGKDIPLGARILKVLIDLAKVAPGETPDRATFDELEKRSSLYDPEILAAAQSFFLGEEDQPVEEPAYEMQAVPVDRLLAGDCLVAHIRTEDGALILAKGEEISQARIEKLRNLCKIRQVKEPIYVQRPNAKAAKALG